jgi:hypothetical protein
MISDRAEPVLLPFTQKGLGLERNQETPRWQCITHGKSIGLGLWTVVSRYGCLTWDVSMTAAVFFFFLFPLSTYDEPRNGLEGIGEEYFRDPSILGVKVSCLSGCIADPFFSIS